jgi:uncharacterized membrane protein YdbT with pleckstrin-like domain
MTAPTLASAEPGEEVLFEGRPALVPSVGALLLSILTLGLWLLPLWWRQRGVSYRVTSRRIVVETGVLSQRLEQVDLYRISDYAVERPFLQRLLGTGNLLLKTLDKTTPELSLYGLRTDVIALYERLRAATESEKRRRGVRVFDME